MKIYIQQKTFFYRTYISFVNNKNRELYMYIDYRSLNKIIKKKIFYLKLVIFFVWLVDGKNLSFIDFKLVYYLTYITNGHAEKTTCTITYGSYKLLVMPFGFCKTSSIFVIFMNTVFNKKIDEFVDVYTNGILVFLKNTKEQSR